MPASANLPDAIAPARGTPVPRAPRRDDALARGPAGRAGRNANMRASAKPAARALRRAQPAVRAATEFGEGGAREVPERRRNARRKRELPASAIFGQARRGSGPGRQAASRRQAVPAKVRGARAASPRAAGARRTRRLGRQAGRQAVRRFGRKAPASADLSHAHRRRPVEGPRVLSAPASREIRPTSERLRESIFDILAHRFEGAVEGARVVDLFAGSGALAIEALSRGAQTALFVDNGGEARALLRANVEALALGGVTRIWRADATKLGKAPAGPPFTLAFLDPPYGKGLAGPALAALVDGGWLAEGALVVVEEAAKAEIAPPEGLRVVDEREYGDTRIVFMVASDSREARA